MKKQSPLLRIWELGETEHGGLIFAMGQRLPGRGAGDAPLHQRGADHHCSAGRKPGAFCLYAMACGGVSRLRGPHPAL